MRYEMADTVGHCRFPVPKFVQFPNVPLQKLVPRAKVEAMRRRRLHELSQSQFASAGYKLWFSSKVKGLSGVILEVCPRPWVWLIHKVDSSFFYNRRSTAIYEDTRRIGKGTID